MASLRKQLGLLDVFCLASGAMVSSGLFVLPGLAHAQAGPAVIISYLIAGALAAASMFSVAEMITAMPKAGGDYFFITRSLGPAAGAVAGLLSWFSLTLKSAFALVGMTAFVAPWLDVNPQVAGLALAALFVGVNLLGAREAGRLQVILVIGLLVLMGVYVALGLEHVDAPRFSPFAPHGWGAVLATAGAVFVSYGGLLKVASVAEEVREPGRNIPLGMGLSLGFILIAYVLMVFVTSGVLGAAQLDHSLTPISDGAAAFLGRPGLLAMSAAAVLAFVSTANAGVMAASRYLLALSADRLMPAWFGQVSRSRGVPFNAVLFTGGFLAASLFLGLELLVKVASTVLILNYMLSNACVMVLRESRLANYRPSFRAPLYPWLQLAGLAGCGLLLIEMGWQALTLSLVLIVAGLVFYWFYGRVRAQREFALQHLVERVSDRDLVSGLLEDELKDIVRQRDEFCADPFDQLLEHALVLDLPGPLTLTELAAELGPRVAERTGWEAEAAARAIIAREGRGSTSLWPGVAVSDVVTPGQGVLRLVAVRLEAGASLPGAQGPVKAFFLLAASPDKRQSYLQTVASLVQTVMAHDFARRWAHARGPQNLRDILLLADRRRNCPLPPNREESA